LGRREDVQFGSSELFARDLFFAVPLHAFDWIRDLSFALDDCACRAGLGH
jgi:hypothetical protein